MDTDRCTEYEPPYVHGEQGERSAQVIQIDSGKHVQVVALCSVLCAVSACLSLFSAYTAIKTERETRMQQYYLLELDARVIAAGIKKPSESIATQESAK